METFHAEIARLRGGQAALRGGESRCALLVAELAGAQDGVAERERAMEALCTQIAWWRGR